MKTTKLFSALFALVAMTAVSCDKIGATYAEVQINYNSPVTYKTGELASVLSDYRAVKTIAWTKPSRVNSSDIKAMSAFDSKTRILDTVEEMDLSQVTFVAGGESYMTASDQSKVYSTVDNHIPSGLAFCAQNLKKVILPENATAIDRFAFYKCFSLSDINLPAKLNRIGFCSFMYVPLTELVIPDAVEVIESSAFNGCEQLTKVTLGKNVKSIGGEPSWNYCFMGMSSMEEYVVSSGNQYFKADNGILTNKAGDVLYSYPSAKLTGSVTLPSGITEIKPYGIDANERALIDLELNEGITKLGMYALCNVWNRTLTLPSTLK